MWYHQQAIESWDEGSTGSKMRESDSLPTIEKLITQDQINKYAEASGDFNPVHVDPDFAACSQFGGTIAHGMMIAATISEAMTSVFKTAWLSSGRLKLRFKAPVFPGETVTAFGRVKKVRELDAGSEIVCSVGVRKPNGTVAITGDATVLITQKSQTLRDSL